MNMTTLEEAETYFTTKLQKRAWDRSSEAMKIAALTESERAINQLAFKGVANTENVPFPRGGQASVPEAIKNAIHENALHLLDGVDNNLEMANLWMTTQDFAGVRTQFDRKSDPADHILAGIASASAWNYLVPFLRNPQEMKVARS